MRRLKAHATPSMVVACMALFVSIGGVGYAAATIGSAQIKNNSVQSKDIKNDTIKQRDLAQGLKDKVNTDVDTDVKGSLTTFDTSGPTNVAFIGGTFATRATLADSFTLPAGTHLIASDGTSLAQWTSRYTRLKPTRTTTSAEIVAIAIGCTRCRIAT